ncbi:MAG: hypothetical protein IPM85_15690 [Chitinophagaceae bacterium]|nr:hypothetical protein [Chitinophagaceae bacterium]
MDSVIYVSDGMAIMVTSEYCTRVDRTTEKPLSDPKLWKAGRDSVFNHPLFSRNHSLDSIKKVLKEQYHFMKPAEKVVFVGYDNKKKKYKTKTKKSAIIPVASGFEGNNQSPFGPQFVTIIAAIIIFSFLIAGGAWLWFQRRAKRMLAA